ncbi:peptidoglycan-binding protein [Kitasatospora sp. NPDC004723]|uniref:peptidoglycan-binding protein n=1 Tax=Kitasatospora sp. NPDC004723 TaxID=3154288 RepID=UPI0033AB4D16
MALKAGVPGLYPRTASCVVGVDWFRSRGRFSAYPAIGAQVFYGSGGGTHTGIVYAYDANFIYTYEGNTSLTNDANGNKVMKRERRRRDSYVYGYGLPAFSEGVTIADPALKGRAGYVYAATASGPAGNSTSSSSTRTVTVRAGQTITAIAAAAGISVAALLSLNPSVKNPDQIHPGDTITLPAVPDGGQEPQQPNPTPPPISPPASNSGTAFPGPSQFGPGATNANVTKLGELLVQRGAGRFYSEGPGPRWTDSDRQAVKAFQSAQGWTGSSADGLPGPQTWRLLVAHQGRDIPAASSAKPSAAPAFPGASRFGPGSVNQHVTVLGQALVRHGYGQYYRQGPGPRWSEADRRAVQAFQHAQGWSGSAADGYPGPLTWSRLMK